MKTEEEEEFYVGYLPQAPQKTSMFVRNVIITIFALMIAGSIALALHQLQFSDGVFNYGSNKEYTGVYSNIPVPSIRIINQKDSTGKLINLSIPLVGYGKHGAESAIEAYEKQNNISLVRKEVTFKGDLLYGEGKILLSLNSLAPIIRLTETKDRPGEMIAMNDTVLMGEIIDPKCYFGVMKPGRGKVHRECAIRCISGGIPPVFRAHKKNGDYEYFLLLGKKGERINQQVLPYVADKVYLPGKLFKWEDWMVIACDMSAIQRINQDHSLLLTKINCRQ
jgi:hypothetical protein